MASPGDWWNMLPFGLGRPIGAFNKWLNAKFGNRDEKFATVDRVNNRSWMGYSIFPGFFQNVADGMKFLVKEHMVPQRADKLIFEVSPFLIVSSTLLILGIIPFQAACMLLTLSYQFSMRLQFSESHQSVYFSLAGLPIISTH